MAAVWPGAGRVSPEAPPAGRIRQHRFARDPGFERALVAAPAPRDWRATARAFNGAFDAQLRLRGNDCGTYADGLLRALAGVPLPEAQGGPFAPPAAAAAEPPDISAW